MPATASSASSASAPVGLPTDAMPRARMCEREFSVGGADLGWLRASDPHRDSLATLQQRLAEDGYLLLRGLLPRSEVEAARVAVLEELAARGQIDRSRPLAEGWIASPEQRAAHPPCGEFFGGDPAMTRTPRFLAMAESAAFLGFFSAFFGEPAMTFDFKWLRAFRSSPRPTNPHTDVIFMGRGEVERLLTCWTPLGDIGPEQGGLAVLRGSQALESYRRIRETYGRADVDIDNIESSLSLDPLELVARYGGQWQTASFAMGDALVFTMHTVHTGMENLTGRIRISADLRFQPAGAPIDERWIGETPRSNYGWHRTPVEPVASYRARWGI
jgi:hypothetical protein